MFRIPSFVFAQLMSSPGKTSVFTSRYEYRIYPDVMQVGSSYYAVVQRKSLSDSSLCEQRLVKLTVKSALLD